MYILLFLVILTIIYINSFKSDFTSEKLQKVSNVLVLITFVILLLCIITSLIR